MADLRRSLHPNRLATRLATLAPSLSGATDLFLRSQFDRLAPEWDRIRADDRWTTDALAAALAAIGSVEPGFAPRAVLDVGTGTGQAALALAGLLPEATIEGVDLSAGMVARAQEKARERGLDARVRFTTASGRRLPVADGSVGLAANVLVQPFADELARVLAPGGWAIFVYGGRPETPIRFDGAALRRVLEPAGLAIVSEGALGRADWTCARRSR